MDLEDVTADLLAFPLAQFTAERNSRVKELKAAGKGALAAEVAKVKKPPVHLWAANQVGRTNPALMRKLRDAAEEVTRTQTGKSATARDLRAASEKFQDALDTGVKAAAESLSRDAHAVTEEAERNIREIMRAAAMQDGADWDQLQRGALATEPAAGDDVLTMFQAGAPPPPRPSPEKGDGDPHEARAVERTARMDAERAEQLEATARRLRVEADDAAAQAKRSDERARAAEKEATEARAQAKRSARRSRP